MHNSSSSSPSRNSSNNNNNNNNNNNSNQPSTSNAAALSAALKGATLAFNKQKAANAVDKQPAVFNQTFNRNQNSSSSASGALLAATQAARDHSASQSRARSPELRSHETGGSSGVRDSEEENGLVAQRAALYSPNTGSTNSNTLLSPSGVGRPSSDNGKQQASASLLAATQALAASRSTSPILPLNSNASRGGASGPGTRRQSVGAASFLSASSGPALGPTDTPDTESIKPTTSLVSLFEGKNEEDMDPVKREQVVRAKARPDPKRREGPTPVTQAGAQDQGQQTPKATPRPNTKPKPQMSSEDLSAISSRENDINHDFEKSKETIHMTEDQAVADPKPRGLPPARPESRNELRGSGRTSTASSSEKVSKPQSRQSRSSTPPPPSVSSSVEVVSPRPIKLIKTPKLEPPIPPVKRRTTVKEATEPAFETAAAGLTQNQSRRASHSSVSSDDTFVSASSNHSPRAVTPTATAKPDLPPPRGSRPKRRASVQSVPAPVPPAPRRPSAPYISSPNLALNSLTNAIVASNLAASRVTASSSPAPPPPPPGRHGRKHSPLQPQRTADALTLNYTGNGGGSRSPNRRNPPQRTGMLQTLRAPPTSLSDDEDARRRMDRHTRRGKLRHLPGKHHAHHEGSRRRWRDEVSAREKRRYEAVWASNRGLFLQPGWAFQGADRISPGSDGGNQREVQVEASRAREGPEAELVVNVVVRDIWGRSRLPVDELAEVWELVDREGRGALGRDEFVVGMWLIDQRLRGRKIPARVGASVWDSVRGGAIRVPDPKSKPSSKMAKAGGGDWRGRK